MIYQGFFYIRTPVKCYCKTSEKLYPVYTISTQFENKKFSVNRTEVYRFGFNGKENDNEVKGTGNQQDYGMRIYDPRLGRFLSIDPLTKSFPQLSPYQFADNNPILNIDLDGLEPLNSNIKFSGSTARPQILSQNAVNVLNSIVKDVGLSKITITSTGRTPAEQARIMYDNLEAGKSSSYKSAGQQVIQVYKDMTKAGTYSPEEIKTKMEQKVLEVGPTNVSKHTADPSQMNAVDFGIGGLQNDLTPDQLNKLKGYLTKLENEGVITRFLNPENNPGEAAFHIEIPATPATNTPTVDKPKSESTSVTKDKPKSN